MSTLPILHDQLQKLGYARQSRLKSDLESVDTILASLKPPLFHPFRLDREGIQAFKLKGSSWYSTGSRGIGTRITGARYLYRLAQVTKLPVYATGWHGTPSREPDPDVLVSRLMLDYNFRRDWLDYKTYASGLFSSPRNISFWTTMEIDFTDLIAAANRVGFPNDWIIKQMVVLRIPSDDPQVQAQIPTSLDAFDSEVFHPTNEVVNPHFGVTIELSRHGPLQIGVEEYVLGPLPIDSIQFVPVLVDDSEIENKGVPSNSSLWILLKAYYESL